MSQGEKEDTGAVLSPLNEEREGPRSQNHFPPHSFSILFVYKLGFLDSISSGDEKNFLDFLKV